MRLLYNKLSISKSILKAVILKNIGFLYSMAMKVTIWSNSNFFINNITFLYSAYRHILLICFNLLKREYSREIDHFIKVHIIHIIKDEFFIAFRIAFDISFTEKNI
jgi:hypothetical protein